jgi:hypothetical protein
MYVEEDGTLDQELIGYDLRSFKKMSLQNAEKFKVLMFGWIITSNEEYKPNLFEVILATPGTEYLINLTWNVFKLWQKVFLLNLVSIVSRDMDEMARNSFTIGIILC